VAPGRKVDPGELFPWAALARAGVGHLVAATPLTRDTGLSEGDRGTRVKALQDMLSAYGYGLEASGTFDRQTRIVVEAFQRHFRRKRVDGIADRSTFWTLERLIAALPRNG